VIESGQPIAHVARDRGVPAETLRRYVRQLEADEGLRPDLPTSEEGDSLMPAHGHLHLLDGGVLEIRKHPREGPSDPVGELLIHLVRGVWHGCRGP
jgi:hypothetical protein